MGGNMKARRISEYITEAAGHTAKYQYYYTPDRVSVSADTVMNDPLFRLAAQTMERASISRSADLIQFLINNSVGATRTIFPLAMIASNDTLFVYPNIVIRRGYGGAHTWSRTMLLGETYANIRRMRSEKEQWRDPKLSRKIILKKEEMPVSRYVTRLFNDGTAGHVIAEAADRVLDMMQPTETFVARTPEDFIRMYTDVGLSCMSIRADYGLTYYPQYAGLYKAVYEKHGLMPHSWMGYHPDVLGVYEQRRGRTINRMLLNNEKKHLGPAYIRFTAALKKAVTDLGYPATHDGLRDKVTISTPFTVPVVPHPTKEHILLTPMVACDIQRLPFRAYFDKDNMQMLYRQTALPEAESKKYASTCMVANMYIGGFLAISAKPPHTICPFSNL